jgi:YD repeat-containing protein
MKTSTRKIATTGAIFIVALWLIVAPVLQAVTVAYTYDSAGRLILVDYGNGTAVRYIYDASGNILSQPVLAARLALTAASPFISVGENGALTLTITFAQGTNTTIALSSSNPAVATVPGSVNLPAGSSSVTVNVTAVGTGTTTITASLPTALGGASAQIELTVAPAPVVQTPFSIADRGGISLITLGISTTPAIGYARIQPAPGSPTPAGLAIFGFRQNGILVSEAGVPASPLIRSGRIYAEVNGPVNTGLALANPNPQAAILTFFFTDANGTTTGSGNTTIAANGQIAAFLNQTPFNGSSSFTGTFTFTSNVPVSAIALRGLANERADFLLTTLPVADLSLVTTGEMVLFPHFADGGGWTTQLVLVNPSDTPMSGTIQLLGQGSGTTPAQPIEVTIDTVTSSTFSYSVPARSAQRLRTAGTAGTARVGSVRITPAPNTRTPSGLGIFSFKNAGITVAEAGVPALSPSRALRMYAETSSAAAGSIQTGVAVANPLAAAATVNFELTTLAGVSTGLTSTAIIPANGQISLFLSQLPVFESLPVPFQGVLRISTTAASGVSVVGLRARVNERGDFLITTTAPVDENSPPSSNELLFPHFADGGGYTTQFILFSRSPGQNSAGTLRFFGQSGQPLSLPLK